MSDTNDTVDGLLAEFRGYSAGMPPGYHVTMSWRDFRVMLDRLEAAHRRECGDAVKLREAVKLATEVSDWCCSQTDDPLECSEYSCYYQVEPHGEAGADCPWRKIRAALAAPPRNCDRFATAEEAWDAYDEWVESYRSRGQTPPFNEFGWLYALTTEKEGESNEQK